MGEALNQFVAEAQGLAAHFDPHTVFSIGGWEVTQYVIWLFIALAVTFAVVLILSLIHISYRGRLARRASDGHFRLGCCPWF